MIITNHLKKHNYYVIAEVGQNHQGDLDLAREYIDVFASCGANAIKFQTRNNKYLFSDDAYNAPYNSENAFSEIYGKHREKLELKTEWLKILKQDCIDRGVAFMSTPFDEPSLKVLHDVDVDIVKIASFDLGNLPLIDKIGKLGKSVVISVGGGNDTQIKDSIKVLSKYPIEIIILHCVSEYPCEYNRLGLGNIKNLIQSFPGCIIGSSDHFNGTLSGPVAYLQGARVFEKHVTLNRSWKGTDHSFALESHGFKSFVRDIHRTPHMMIEKPKDDLGKEPVFQKLGKSLVASKDINKGEVFDFDNISGKIFRETYIPVRDSNKIIGLKAKSEIKNGEPIPKEYIE